METRLSRAKKKFRKDKNLKGSFLFLFINKENKDIFKRKISNHLN